MWVRPVSDAAGRVLDAVDALQAPMMRLAEEALRIPSVSGTDAENEGQAWVADVYRDAGLDVDHWRIDLAELASAPEFPGMEVDRHEAWGLVGRRTGAGDGPTLMLNGHIDVVPIGDPTA